MAIKIDGTNGITNASWTTATRPSSPVAGQQGFNSDLGYIEVYDGTEWKIAGFLAEGGDVTTITDGGVTYKVHTFTSSGTFNVLAGSAEVEYLVVAGGGGGGCANGGGAGGGAGGYRSSVIGESSGGGASAESTLIVTPQSYTVTIGAGGTGGAITGEGLKGNPGSNSVFGSITSLGGGYGGGDDSRPGGSGGSGGGAARDNLTAGTGTSGQGYSGGASGGSNAGGGGGGAGGVGTNGVGNQTGGDGGIGVQSLITGTATYRAGGGGGGSETPVSAADAGAGGLGGGGAGGAAGSVGTIPTPGTANTGGGGGGSGDFNSGGNYPGQNGGSGVVIIRYKIG
jgi:hypothetical protein